MSDRHTVDVPGAGDCALPHEFFVFSGQPARVERHDSRESPSLIHSRLALGVSVVLSGPYPYVDGVMRYCQRHEKALVDAGEFSHIEDRGQRSAALTAARRRKLHNLFVLARGNELPETEDPPDTSELERWLEAPPGEGSFLIPVRRLQRILTDAARARDGMHVEALGGRIRILPHVYVPADLSVPAMFVEYAALMSGRDVLDIGTGTGILALLAARMGARSVVATDSNPNAVKAARMNADLLGLSGVVSVRGPGDMYDPVRDEDFDLIIFNAPWIQGVPETLYDTANYDPGYRVVDAFLRGAPGHMRTGGSVLLQYSNISERKGENSMARLGESVRSAGLAVKSERIVTRLSRTLGAREKVYLFELERSPAGRGPGQSPASLRA